MTDPIWRITPDLAALNERNKSDINGHLGVELTEFGPDWLKGRIPVDHRTRQPYGILHGGASVVLAETLGSLASSLCIDNEKFFCVGQEVNANHLRAAREGWVSGIARPFHIGRTSMVWGIELTDQDGKRTCVARLTVAVVPRPQG